MNRPRLPIAGFALLLPMLLFYVEQAWSLPTENLSDEAGYVGDDADSEGGDEGGDSASLPSGPVLPQTKQEVFVVAKGSRILLPCNFSNSEDITISWIQLSKNKEDKDNYLFMDESKLISDKDNHFRVLPNHSLEISNVQEADGAQYVCKALMAEEPSALNPKIEHTVEVIPDGSEVGKDYGGVIVLTPSAENDVEQGANLTLGCEVHGQELINQIKGISFSREGYRLKLDEETGHSIRLRVNNASRHVAGDYVCLIEIGRSKPLIKYLKLRVRHKPEIEYEREQVGTYIRAKEHYITRVGNNVVSQISCVVHSHPPVTKLHWLKDESILKIDGRHLVKSDPLRSHHVLRINGTLKSDLGRYRCRASNELGETTGPAIYLTDSPDQPVFKSGNAVDDAIELRWSVISYKPIVQADIVYHKQGEQDNWIEAKDVKVISSLGKEHIIQGKIHGIAPGLYEAKARAYNIEEYSDVSLQAPHWGPFSDLKKFDGEYNDDADVASVKDSATKSSIHLMTLVLLVLSPFAYYSSRL